MSKKMKNIAQSEVLTLREQISYQEGQVVSKTLTQNQAVSITLFSFAKGEEISTHESGGDAFVTCLDGIGKITIDGVEYLLHEGESIVMPAGHPHTILKRPCIPLAPAFLLSSMYTFITSFSLHKNPNVS